MTAIAFISRIQYDAHVRVTDADDSHTMDQLAAACALPAIGCQTRHPRPGRPLRIRRTTDDDSAKTFPRDMTIREAGLRHFDCIDVIVE